MEGTWHQEEAKKYKLKSGWLSQRRVPGGYLAPRGSHPGEAKKLKLLGKQGEKKGVVKGTKVVGSNLKVFPNHKEECQEGTWHPQGEPRNTNFGKQGEMT